MCGILAYASTRPHPDPRTLAGQRDKLSHRGPDDAGLWHSDDARVVLAHRRLSIIDLSAAGCQPLLHSGSGVRIILNGEIYNYRELRSELHSKGHTFTTETDTEVLAAAYAQWSTAAVQHLVGMFAFVLYDPHTRKVFAARDRAGEKPLYYWRDGAAHWFASELKALLHEPRMPRRLNYAALDQYLAYGYVPGEDVLIEGVRKVPAAHAVEFDIAAGTMLMWRYWSLPAAGTGSLGDSERELEKRLETAVRRQLVADVPVGIMLSGGVDSSLITALTTRVAGPPRTFTVSFRGAGKYDEAPFARLIAEYFHTEHHELVAEPASIDVLPALAEQFDEPIADASIVPNFLVAKAIREHAKVALGGNGGDELFGGYRTYQWVLRQRQLRTALPGPVRTMVAQLADSLPAGFRARNYLRGLADDTARAVANVNLYFDVAMRRRLVPHLADANARTGPEDRKAALWAGQSLVQQLTRTDFETYLAESILLKEDRASMLASLEVRSPFLDVDVIEFAFGSLPDELRVTARARKVLLARLAKRLLPPQFDSTRKQGFSVPVDRWLKDDWGRFFRSVLLSDSATLFDRSTVTRLLDTRAPGVVHGNRLFNLTMLELWRRAFSIGI